MSQSRIPSPARSQGAPVTPRRSKSRTRSVGSPARSTTSGRLSALIQFKENNKDSFALSPAPSRRSVLNDDTDIEEPRRRSWWKKLSDNSRDVMEVLNDNKVLETNAAVEEYIDIEVLSQEKKHYSIDIPDSSDSESISSIIIPQRKLFTQKDQAQDKFSQLIGTRETLAKLQKSHVADKTVNVAPKNLFGQGTKPRAKPVFPSALLNVSPDKTINKTKENVGAEVKGQVRSLFGNRAGTKRKNMFADFIVSESEDEISEIQPRVFEFPKKPDTRRGSANSRGKREHSPTSSVTTDIEMDDWKMLPSSTMVENQLEDMMAAAKTPVKRPRLSNLDDIQELPTKKSAEQIEKEQSDGEQELKYDDEDGKSDKNEPNEEQREIMDVENEAENDEQNVIQLPKNTSKVIDTKVAESNKINQKDLSSEELQKQNISTGNILNQSKTLNKSKQELNVSQKKTNLSKQKVLQKQPIVNDEVMESEEERNNKSVSYIKKSKSNMEMQADQEKVCDKSKERNEYKGQRSGLENVDDLGKHVDEVDNLVVVEEMEVENENPNLELEVAVGQNHNESKSVEMKQVSNEEINISRNANNASPEQNNTSGPIATKEIEIKEQNLVGQDQKENDVQNEMQDSNNSDKDDGNESDEGIQNESEIIEQDDVEEQEENESEHDESETEVQNETEVQDEDIEARNESEEEIQENDEESDVVHESDQEKSEENKLHNDSDDNENDETQHESEVEKQEDEAKVQNETEEDVQNEYDIEQDEEVDERQNSDVQDELNDTQNESNEEHEEPDEMEEEPQNESSEVEDEIDNEQNDTNGDDELEDEDQHESVEAEDEMEEDVQNESDVEQNETQDENHEENEMDNEQNESSEIQNEIVDDAQNVSAEENEGREQSDDEIQDSNDHQESNNEQDLRNETHDTTGRHRKKNETQIQSPEAILHDKTNQLESFTAKGRNTSIRKTTMLKDLNVRPSLAPPRESTGLSDGTRNSSAEGSGWDSHRTTRKTLRQTFGRDFTPRKSLRALVMEKSAKRQTAVNEITSVTAKFPQANSTEFPEASMADDNEISSESNHDVSKRTRQTTLEMYLQKIKKQNMERKLKMEEAVRNSLKAPTREVFNPFKVPANPVFSKRKPTKQASKPKAKPVKSTLIPLDDLPAEVVEDMKYKPPKRFQPSNASWITKRLYKFLESKLEAKYDYKARVRAEKLVESIYQFSKELRRADAAPAAAVDALKHEMARLDVVRTHFDFYQFFHEYMPREIRVKVVPDVVNKINVPRHGVFSDIIRGNTVQG